jgi:hypothetical protein
MRKRDSRVGRPGDLFRQGVGQSGVVSLMPPRSLFSPRKRCLLRGSTIFSLAAPNTGAAVARTMILNGLSNFDVTGATGTPYLYTFLSNMYGKYRVDRCRYTLRFYDTTADGLVVGAQLRGSTPVGSFVQQLQQRPGNVTMAMSNTGEQSVVIKCDTDCAAAFGQTKAIYHANYGAAINANPGAGSSDYSLTLYAYALSPVGTATTVYCNVTMEWEVDLFDLLV